MIIVTGASKGIGFSLVERLIAKGNDVFCISRNFNNNSANGMSCDISSYEQVKKVSRFVKKEGFRQLTICYIRE